MAPLANDLLGARCPFGTDSSAKHMSLEANCPDLREASSADRQISHALRSFQGFAGESDTRWRRRPLDRFEEIGRSAKLIHDSSPGSFGEIFPLDESRNGQALLARVEEADSLMSRALLAAHRNTKLRVRSDRLAARSMMAAIGHRWAEVSAEDGVGELQLATLIDRLATKRHPANGWRAPDAFGSDRSIAISAASLHTLITYQTVQERIDSAAAIEAVNLGLADRLDVLESLLGIQAAIVSDLQAWVDADPSRIGLARAFSEIALVESDGTLIPNSRFLKILAHNWGEFITECPSKRIDEIVTFCGSRARLNLIYEQNIFVVRRADNVRTLFGVAVRACPAAAVIAPLVQLYASRGEI